MERRHEQFQEEAMQEYAGVLSRDFLEDLNNDLEIAVSRGEITAKQAAKDRAQLERAAKRPMKAKKESQVISIIEKAEGEPFGFGAFYNAYGARERESGLQREIAYKELKLNYLFSEEDAVGILARHEVEQERLEKYFGDFIPPSIFLYPEDKADLFKQEKSYAQSGKKLYPFHTFARIQMDRRMQVRYARRDVEEERSGVDKLFSMAGKALSKIGAFREKGAGVMVQERIHGITFQEYFDHFTHGNGVRYEELKKNVKKFIEAIRRFHADGYALLWHRLDSDNVVVEVDKEGQPTGQVFLIDLNFTERSAEFIRKKVTSRLEDNILKPIEERFGLIQEK